VHPRTTIEAAVDLARAGASERLRSLANLVVRCAIGSAAPFRTGRCATPDVPSRTTLGRGRPHMSTSSGSISATDPSPRIRVACTGCGLVSAPVIRAYLDRCVSAIREVAPANGVGSGLPWHLGRGLLLFEVLALPLPTAWAWQEAPAADRADRLADDAGRPLAGAARARVDPLGTGAAFRTAARVGGHEILPVGGHRNSPRAAANSPRGRPRISPPVLS